ncbi:low molecular weight protein tyrosine phosphatase family protein [Oceanospirillum sediminis]|uniref:Phosphotyrosine protein phosphatase n=1 Tax=Oceanospirillum sediminis TaxID=2760088 RepID=A0A839IYY9_9GAMM|nr:phosphotyrosine protein phosphatase [Oceanospirillum sediminis]MBB1489659.1 phosphotyrosine protein phosphatase [Oceanospirillum sediminis]
MSKRLNLLFICSRNQWRSPTGEAIWKKCSGFDTRSAGTSPNARKSVSPADIRWADYIFVMEDKHKNKLLAEFSRMMNHKPLYVLNIPDEYRFMDQELICELKEKVSYFLSFHIAG